MRPNLYGLAAQNQKQEASEKKKKGSKVSQTLLCTTFTFKPTYGQCVWLSVEDNVGLILMDKYNMIVNYHGFINKIS